MPNDHINPPGVSTPTGYTHVVSAPGGGRIVFISGQVAAGASGQVVGEGDLARQADQVFENLKTCLAAAGATFADVTKLTTYVVNYKPEDRPAIVAARQRHLPADAPPASTLVGVQALAAPAYLIEIEAVAVLP
jgi:enamine deaminase RidA (YjgF/YER057c/UK114 family)